MKIVNIIGGLGNQMFQYAFALALKEHFPEEEVLIDTSHFHYVFLKKFRSANLHYGYEIGSIFPAADLPIAKAVQLRKVTRYIPNYAISRIARKLFKARPTEFIQKPNEYFAFDSSVFEQKGDCYYEGIWESVQYVTPIRDQIREVFSSPALDLRNEDMIRRIEKENSVGIHVRRGDYLHNANFCGICEVDYYKRAVEIIMADGKAHSFYIFSNDMTWCEENIRPLLANSQIQMVSLNTNTHSYRDMFLMSHCQNLIIANSSFSWWGAFLNSRGGHVVAPKKWVNRDAEFDIWLPEWTRI